MRKNNNAEISILLKVLVVNISSKTLTLVKTPTQGVSNLTEADRRITAIDFELLVQPASVEPFIGFTNPRKIIRDFASRIS